MVELCEFVMQALLTVYMMISCIPATTSHGKVFVDILSNRFYHSSKKKHALIVLYYKYSNACLYRWFL